METDIAVRIERARELLHTVRHAALATVNADGSPHNSPVFAGFGGGTTMYWASAPDALHSQNIARTSQVFIVLFDSMDKGGGLYLKCASGVVEDPLLDQGLATFNASLAKLGRSTIGHEHVSGAATQRLYHATPQQAWVNMSQKDATGRILQDRRYEISIEDLVR